MRVLIVGALVCCVMVGLACAGAGSDAPVQPVVVSAPGVWVRPWAVVSARVPWPASSDNLVTATVDDDPFTGFDVGPGDTLAYFLPTTKQVLSVQLMARSDKLVQLRWLSRSGRGAKTLTTSEWVAVEAGPTRLVETPMTTEGAVVGFELRLGAKAKVMEVRAMAKDGFEPSPTGAWVFYDVPRTSDAVSTYADLQRLRFATFDPDACTAHKLGGGPEQRLTDATCTPTDAGVQVTGDFPPFGPIDEVVSYVEIGPCMALVDGFVMSKKGCRKRD